MARGGSAASSDGSAADGVNAPTRSVIEDWTTLQPGAPSDGDERLCGSCDQEIPAGETVWWSGGDDGDPYCTPCAELIADAHRGMCQAFDRGEIAP